MQGVKRKLVYVTAYELIGMTISALGLALLSGHAPSSTGPLAVVITTLAVSWNFIYNYLFEWWESRQGVAHPHPQAPHFARSGLSADAGSVSDPLIAWWMGITLWQALLLDMALIVIIPCYTFLFNWAFDKLFGLPASALPAGESA